MKWKLIALLAAVSLIYGLFDNDRRDILRLVSIPIDIISTIGLIIYAFRLPGNDARMWRPFSWFFAIWAAFSINLSVIIGLKSGSPIYAIVGAVLIAAVMSYVTWLALNRLGRAQPA